MATEGKIDEPTKPSQAALPKKLAQGALCGSFTCGGCYSVGDGIEFHPPRPGYSQEKLGELD